MAQESSTSPPDDVHAHLRAIADLLRQPHRLDAAAQTALADLVEELDKALKLGAMPTEKATRLTASATQFALAVGRADESGLLQAARARLEEAAVAAESNSPLAAGLARRIMNALANLGI